jgi:2-methylcitrate dehydratase PrpD
MSADISRVLSDFACELDLADVPSDVVDNAKLFILDQLGCIIAGAELPWSSAVREYSVTHAKPGLSTVLPAGHRLDAEFAVLANATAGHAFEIDDYHRYSSHPGCVVIPCAIALAEQEENVSGREVLTAVVAGYEATIRIARGAWPEAMLERGFHTTSSQGPLGSSLVAARLMGLDREEALNALGIAASHASGTVEYAQSRGSVKRFHAGMAAAAGIRSARLARLGLTGPTQPIEGNKGLLNAWTSAPRPDWIVEGLGSEWVTSGTCIKPYACCGIIHAPIDAFHKISDNPAFSVEDIEEVVVGTNNLGLLMGGTDRPVPSDMTGAQFSNQFSLAMTAIAGRNDARTYRESMPSGVPDPRMTELARKIRIECDDEAEAVHPERFFARVTVIKKSGERLVATADAKGSVENPLSAAELIEKFKVNAGEVLAEKEVQAVVDAVLALEELPDIAGVVSRLVEK